MQLFSSKPKAKKRRLAHPTPAPDAAEQRLASSEAPLEAVERAAALAPGEQSPAGAEPGEEATFRQLGLSEWLERVCAGLGMQAPTAVQRGTIPAVLAGRDVIGVAHTGSGKTAAFALPILQKLAKDPYGVFALVLTPTRCAPPTSRRSVAFPCLHRRTSAACTAVRAPCRPNATPAHSATCRELAFQLADQFRALGAGMSLKDCVVVGGLDMQQQVRAWRAPLAACCSSARTACCLCKPPACCVRRPPYPPAQCRSCCLPAPHLQAKELSRRPHVVIATPGRLRALLEMDADLARGFGRARFLVLDEADRLLEPSFESELAVVLQVCNRGPSDGCVHVVVATCKWLCACCCGLSLDELNLQWVLHKIAVACPGRAATVQAWPRQGALALPACCSRTLCRQALTPCRWSTCLLLQVLPAQRQTLLFSATMTRTLTELQSQLLTDAYHFQVGRA